MSPQDANKMMLLIERQTLALEAIAEHLSKIRWG